MRDAWFTMFFSELLIHVAMDALREYYPDGLPMDDERADLSRFYALLREKLADLEIPCCPFQEVRELVVAAGAKFRDGKAFLESREGEDDPSEKPFLHSIRFSLLARKANRIVPTNVRIEKETYEFDNGWQGLYAAVFLHCQRYYPGVFSVCFFRMSGKSLFLEGDPSSPNRYLLDDFLVELDDGFFLNTDLTVNETITAVETLLKEMFIYPKDVRVFYKPNRNAERLLFFMSDFATTPKLRRLYAPVQLSFCEKNFRCKDGWKGMFVELLKWFFDTYPSTFRSFCEQQRKLRNAPILLIAERAKSDDSAVLLYRDTVLQLDIVLNLDFSEEDLFQIMLSVFKKIKSSIEKVRVYCRAKDADDVVETEEVEKELSVEREEGATQDPSERVKDVRPVEEATPPSPSVSAPTPSPENNRQDPLIAPATRVLERFFPDKTLRGSRELVNFLRLLKEESGDADVSNMSRLREDSLLKELGAKYDKNASAQPRGEAQESQELPKPKARGMFTALRVNAVDDATSDSCSKKFEFADDADRRAVETILKERFQDGFDCASVADVQLVRDLLRNDYSKLTDSFTDEETARIVASVGFECDGRVYYLRPDAKGVAETLLDQALNAERTRVVFYEELFNCAQETLREVGVVNAKLFERVLKARGEELFNLLATVRFADGYASFDRFEDKRAAVLSEIRLALACSDKSLSADEICALKPMIPKQEILDALEENEGWKGSDSLYSYESADDLDDFYSDFYDDDEDEEDDEEEEEAEEDESENIQKALDALFDPQDDFFDSFFKVEDEPIDQFDDEVARRLLANHFANGFRFNSPVDRAKLVRYAQQEKEPLFDELDPEDENEDFWNAFKDALERATQLVDEKYFALEQEVVDDIRNAFLDAFENRGFRVLFSNELRKEMSDQDRLPVWIGNNEFCQLLQRFFPEFACKTGVEHPRFMRKEDAETSEKEIMLREALDFWGDDFMLEDEQLRARLPYVPLERLKFHMSKPNSGFISNQSNGYAKRDFVEIPEKIKNKVLEIVNEEVERRGFMPVADLPIDDLRPLNEEASDKFWKNALIDLYLLDDFMTSGATLVKRGGEKATIAAAFKKRFKNQKKFRLDEARDFHKSIRASAEMSETLRYCHECSVRVNQDEFLPLDAIHFDVDATDDAILKILEERDYLPLKAFLNLDSALPAPEESYPWTQFLLESYCRHFSRKLRFDVLTPNSMNIGSVIRKSCPMSYHEIMVDLIVNLKEKNVDEERALERLVAYGLLAKRFYKKIADLVKEANEKLEGGY